MTNETTTQFSPGDRMMVYEDPITEDRLEGWATLWEYVGTYYPCEDWMVTFDDDDPDDSPSRRRIRADGRNTGGR